MTYDFDQHINRIGTDCLKYDTIFEMVGRSDIRPMWVADMDFATPPFVLDAISKRLRNQIIGYTIPMDKFYQSIQDWQERRHGVVLTKEQIHFTPGVVPGIHHAITALTEKKDKILIMTPVYHPFHHVIEINERVKVESSLRLVNGRFEMDFDDIEQKLPGCRMAILCNPHNPGGTIWSDDELVKFAKLCHKNNVLVVSDEIHSDMVLPGYKHRPFVNSCPEAKEITLALNAPSKTFNMPGIITSYYYCYNDDLRAKFWNFLKTADVTIGNAFAYDCLQACYSEEGENWLNQMLGYIAGNIKTVEEFLATNCPKIRPMKTEASFLVFLDNREMPFENSDEVMDFYLNKANLFLNEGAMFGSDGAKFMRLNIALPRKELIEALEMLKAAYLQLA